MAKVLSLHHYNRGRVSQCYANSQRLLLEDSGKRLRYWGLWGPYQVPHAWLTINGKVVDVTAEALGPKDGRNDEHSYIGFMVNRRSVWRNIRESGYFCRVIRNVEKPLM